MPRLTDTVIDAAIRGFEAQKKEIDAQIAELRAMKTGADVAATDNAAPEKPKRRKLSAAVRARMKAAQQLRWAKARGASVSSGAEAPAKKAAVKAPAKAAAKTARPKPKFSAAARKALSIAMKKRWAAKKVGA